MLQDLNPICKHFDEKEITIIPIYDLHIGSEHFDMQAWERFITELQKTENTYIVIGGDCLDNGLKTSVTLVYEQTLRPSAQKKYLAETLEPIKNKVLCGISGNHEYRSTRESDDNPLFDTFAKLDIEDRFRENGAFLFLQCGDRHRENGTQTPGDTRPFYCIMVHHGTGGGMYIGSQAYKQERYASMVEGLDVLITGHTHKPLTFPAAKLVCDPRNKRVSVKEFRVVTANSWLDYGGYAFRKMLPPTAKTMTEILLNGTKKQIRITQ